MSITTLSFFDLASETISYVLSDGQHAAVIDSVLDFDATSGSVSTLSADRIIDAIESRGLKVQWILETHAHTDHLSAASYLKRRLGGQIAIGENICQVQRIFKRLYNLEPGFLADGSPFDRLLKDGESFRVGGLEVTALLILVVAALMARPIRSDLADARPQPARRRDLHVSGTGLGASALDGRFVQYSRTDPASATAPTAVTAHFLWIRRNAMAGSEAGPVQLM